MCSWGTWKSQDTTNFVRGVLESELERKRREVKELEARITKLVEDDAAYAQTDRGREATRRATQETPA